LKDLVRCRAEHSYPGRPLEVWYSGRWQKVIEILEESLVPNGKRFRVICEDENEFCLEYDPVLDRWQVTAAGESGI